jgi:hypothetical protein
MQVALMLKYSKSYREGDIALQGFLTIANKTSLCHSFDQAIILEFQVANTMTTLSLHAAV